MRFGPRGHAPLPGDYGGAESEGRLPVFLTPFHHPKLNLPKLPDLIAKAMRFLRRQACVEGDVLVWSAPIRSRTTSYSGIQAVRYFAPVVQVLVVIRDSFCEQTP